MYGLDWIMRIMPFWWFLPCELLCHIWPSWGVCHSWLCILVVVVVVVELYADIHNSSPFHTRTLLRAHALECSSFNCWGLMPWNTLSFNYWGLMPRNASTIQIVEGSCPVMLCHSNALNGTTCICIVALSLVVVVSCIVVVVDWVVVVVVDVVVVSWVWRWW